MASPDASPRKSPPEEVPKPTGKNTHIRFLVSNVEAGVVIGKGGSTINDFQSQSGARIHLSRNNEFFPGTADRIVAVSGTIDNTLMAVDLIVSKLQHEFCIKDGDGAEPTSSLKIIVPSSSCGGLIGKGAATLRSFKEESRADIVVSPQDYSYHGPDYRLVIIDGTIDEQMLAIDLILSKLAEDLHYAQSVHTPFPFAGYSRPYFASNGVGRKFQNDKVDQNSSVTIGVSDDHIGPVVGRGGRKLTEIIQASGARIKISARDDFIPGTHERKVTITGSQRAIRQAEDMIAERVSFAERLEA